MAHFISVCKLLSIKAVIQTGILTRSKELHRHISGYKYLKKCLAGNEKGSDNHQTKKIPKCFEMAAEV